MQTLTLEDFNAGYAFAEPVLDPRELEAKELANNLNIIAYQIAELARIKEHLEAKLCNILQHGDDYSKTYNVGKFKVTCRTGFIYSLDKEEYAIIGSRLPKIFNPVKSKISYEIDKNVMREAEKYASQEELNLLAQVISKKPSKLSISVKAGV